MGSIYYFVLIHVSRVAHTLVSQLTPIDAFSNTTSVKIKVELGEHTIKDHGNNTQSYYYFHVFHTIMSFMFHVF